MVIYDDLTAGTYSPVRKRCLKDAGLRQRVAAATVSNRRGKIPIEVRIHSARDMTIKVLRPPLVRLQQVESAIDHPTLVSIIDSLEFRDLDELMKACHFVPDGGLFRPIINSIHV